MFDAILKKLFFIGPPVALLHSRLEHCRLNYSLCFHLCTAASAQGSALLRTPEEFHQT